MVPSAEMLARVRLTGLPSERVKVSEGSATLSSTRLIRMVRRVVPVGNVRVPERGV